jgi:hypothetical protein
LAAVRRLDVLESVSAGKIACPKSIFEESTGMSIRELARAALVGQASACQRPLAGVFLHSLASPLIP